MLRFNLQIEVLIRDHYSRGAIRPKLPFENYLLNGSNQTQSGQIPWFNVG